MKSPPAGIAGWAISNHPVTAMNSPTIAAVVSSLKPQAARASGAPADDAAQPRFADVLANQAPAGKEKASADARTEPEAPGASSPASLGDSAKAAETDEQPAKDAEASEREAADEDALAVLPQIALEIALHARGHAAEAGRAHAKESLPASDTRLADPRPHATHSHVAGDLKAAPAILDAEAPGTHASGANSAAALTNAASALGQAGDGHGLRENRGAGIELPAARRHGAARSPHTALGSGADTITDKPAGPAAAADVPASSRSGDGAFGMAQSAVALNETAVRGAQAAAAADPLAAGSGAAAGLNPFSQASSPVPGTGQAIATPLHQSGWDADFGRQVVMLARDAHSGAQTAELRLDPPELGPLRISISLSDGTASAVFVSAHASVRQAVESALPQLSQQLAQAGISLGQTHVGDQGQGGFARQDGGSPAGAQSSGGGAGTVLASAEVAAAPRGSAVSNGLVDTFA